MDELGKADYERARPLFRELGYQLITAAVLDGGGPGRVFVDNPNDPQTAFMYFPDIWCYLAGNPHHDAFNHALNRAIFAREAIDRQTGAMLLVYHPAGWREKLDIVLAPRRPVAWLRQHYVCRALTYDWRANVPDGFSVHRIDTTWLSHPRMAVPGEVTKWIEDSWGSAANFLESGFGFVTIHSGEMVCWVIADCVSDGAAEIGVFTVGDYRRRGLATLTTAAAVEYAFGCGLEWVGWQCGEDNIGSIRTAKKVGFEKERDYTAHFIVMDEKRHLGIVRTVIPELNEKSEAALRDGQYQRAADLCEELLSLQDGPHPAHYHLAAQAQAGLGNQDKGLAYLNAAVDGGWNYFSHTRLCGEFASLRDRPEWEALLERIKHNRSGTEA